MDFIVNIDFSILNFIQEHIRNSFLDPVMMVLSYMGEYGVFWILLAIILLFFAKQEPQAFAFWRLWRWDFCAEILSLKILSRVRDRFCSTRPLI